MLKLTRVTTSWPHLIGVAAGIYGAAVSLATGSRMAAMGSLRAEALPVFVTAIGGFVFLFLAFPLYTGRDWARRGVLVATCCIIAALIAFVFPTLFPPGRPSSAPLYAVIRGLIGACSFLSFLTPPAFFVAVLHHPDVRRTFQVNASNQAMQPTPGRRTT